MLESLFNKVAGRSLHLMFDRLLNTPLGLRIRKNEIERFSNGKIKKGKICKVGITL